jgi:hypothetical protein
VTVTSSAAPRGIADSSAREVIVSTRDSVSARDTMIAWVSIA